MSGASQHVAARVRVCARAHVRGACLLIAAALVAGQAPVTDVTAISGDTFLRVSWSPPADATGVRTYTATAEPADVPRVPALTTTYADEFSTTVLDAAAWSSTRGACPLSPGATCALTPTASLSQAGGALRVTTPARQGLSPITGLTAANAWGNNGVPALLPRARVNEAGAPVVVWVSVDVDTVAAAGNGSEAGIWLYDDATGAQRGRLRLFLRYFDRSSMANGVYARWCTPVGVGVTSLTCQEGVVAPSVRLPVELYLVRSEGRFQFATRSVGEPFPIVSTLSVSDATLGVTTFTSSNFGVFTSNPSDVIRQAQFLWFRIVPWPSWLAARQAIDDSNFRNETIARSGVCAVSRTVSRSVLATDALYSVTLRGLMNGIAYNVFVVSRTATLSSARVFAAAPATPMPAYPPGLTRMPGVFLDASTLPASNYAMQYWPDSSGFGRHFGQANAGSQPTVSTTSGIPGMPAVVFPNGQPKAMSQLVNDGYGTLLPPASGDSNYTWFLLYKPDPQFWYSMGVFSKGAIGRPGWELVGLYSSGNNGAGFRLYGGTNTNSVGVNRQWSGVASHADSTNPTLITYQYYRAGPSAVNPTYQLDACLGINLGVPADRCNNPAPGVTPAPASPWILGYANTGNFYSQPFTTIPSNRNVQQNATWVPSGDALRISDLSGTGSTTNYYMGDLYAIAMIDAAISRPERQALQEWLLDRFRQRCPVIRSMNSTGSCSGIVARGASCPQSCIAPAIPIGGTSVGVTPVCNNGQLTTKGLRCGAQCPVIASPANVGSCRKILLNETFSDGTQPLAKQTYDMLPDVPATRAATYFEQQNGTLLADLPTRDDVCSPVLPSTLIVNAPLWAEPGTPATEPLTVSVNVILRHAGARAGLAFRVTSTATAFSMYRFAITAGSSGAVMEKIVAGTVTSFTTSTGSLGTLQPNVRYSLRCVLQRSSIQCFVNNARLADVTDAELPFGTVGLHAETGQARFSDWLVVSECDANGNCRAVQGEQCQYACAAGYTGVGTPVQECQNSGAYAGQPFECRLTPPSVPASQTFAVPEDAPQGYVLGTVNATLAQAGQVPLFELLSDGNNETERDAGGNEIGVTLDVFAVNLCSGVLSLAKSGVLNYLTGSRRFVLTVRVRMASSADVYSDALLVVDVLDAVSPPVFPPESGSSRVYRRSIDENAAIGSVLQPPIVAGSPDNIPLAYDLVFTDAPGMFGINNATGELVVTGAPLDFEAKPLYQLVVRASLTGNASGSRVVNVELSLRNVNDAPVAVSQFLSIDETESLAGVVVGRLNVLDQDAGDALTYRILTITHTGIAVNGTSGDIVLQRNFLYPSEQFPAFLVDGIAARDVIRMIVAATDTGGLTAEFNVTVYIAANISRMAEPVIDSITFPADGLASAGGQAITIAGANFDALTDALRYANRFFVVYGTMDGARLYNATPCAVLSADTMQCTSAPGWGKDLSLRLFFGMTLQLAGFRALDSILLSYAAPSITTLTPGGGVQLGALLTSGQQEVQVVGRNVGVPGAPTFLLYGPQFQFAAPMIRDASSPNYATGYIKFSTVPGVGTNLPAKLVVGDQESAVWATRLAYAPPTVTALETPSTTYTIGTLSPRGGFATNQWVYIRGSNFGPDPTPITITYGSRPTIEVSGLLQTVTLSFAPNCTRAAGAAAHSLLMCRPAPGVGLSHPVTIVVGGRNVTTAPPLVVSYASPSLSSISGAGSRLADTKGGQVVVLSGANLGPLSMGAGTLGVTSAPITVRFGRTGAELVAQGCFVSRETPSEVTCSMPEGTGTGFSWRLIVGGQATPMLAVPTSGYAPPVVTGFRLLDDASIRELPTTGLTPIVLAGTNFGAAAGALLTVSYSTRPKSYDTAYNTTIVPRGSRLVYAATACIMLVPHEQLQCNTAEGAGTDLEWTVSVDGQNSSLPSSAYAAPLITAVQAVDGSPATAVNSDGGDTLRLLGDNFGPGENGGRNCVNGSWIAAASRRCRGLVQSITFGPQGTLYTVTDFTVVTDGEILVLIPAGFGVNLRFVVKVADQVSQPSADTMSYELPTILSLTPATGPTNPSISNPTQLTISGRGFALLDAGAEVGVQWGNIADGTLRPTLLQPFRRSPDMSQPRSVASYLQGGARGVHTLVINLPEGVLPDRAVRVVVSRKGDNAALSVASEPARAPASFFSYLAPNISAVVVSNLPQDNVDMIRFIYIAMAPPSLAAVFQITILGTNFGPNGTVNADTVARVVEAEVSPGVFVPGQVVVYSWSHTAIIGFTTLTSATVRVGLTGATFTGAPLTVYSGSYRYDDLSPSVSQLIGSAGPFSTSADGAIISFYATNLQSTRRSLDVTVGGRPCPLVQGGQRLSSTAAVAAIVQSTDPTIRVTGATAVDTRWLITCELPPGQGVSVPVVVIRDGTSPSLGDVTVSYRAPTITGFSVWNAGTREWSQPVDVTTTPTAAILVPTDGTLVRLLGSNFGVCPLVVMPFGRVALGVSCTGSVGPASHTTLNFTSADGEGSGVTPDDAVGFTVFLNVGEQLSNVVRFRYIQPVVASVTGAVGTRGNGQIVITGANFGRLDTTPDTTSVVLSNDAGVSAAGGSIQCGNVTRINLATLVCTVPAGSGYNFSVEVTVANQTGVLRDAFSYMPPVITSIFIANSTAVQQVMATYGSFGPSPNSIPLRFEGAGGQNVTLVGSNFGARIRGRQCLFIAWRGRGPAAKFACDDRRTFIGENEVPQVAIRSWSHERIVFVFPPGAGARDILVSAAGQMPRVSPVVHYLPPVITAGPVPALGPTEGNSSIAVIGANFGRGPVRWTSFSDVNASMFTFPSSLQEYLGETPLPQEIMRVNFHRTCISEYTTLDEASGTIVRPPAIRVCTPGLVSAGFGPTPTGHSNTRIVFSLPRGIGANRTVSITITDVQPSAVQPGTMETLTFTSNQVLFSYLPPSVESTLPWPVSLDGGDGKLVRMTGRNFGTPDSSWTTEDAVVSIMIGGVPCSSPQRPVRDGATLLECRLGDGTVGRKNITYVVAGQLGFTSASSSAAAFLACAPTFFGREGERCLPCPFGARCAGYDVILRTRPGSSATEGAVHTYPRPLAGFFNLNGSMLTSCPASAAYTGRDVCIVACEPPEACLGDNYCATGYASEPPYYRCASCAPGFFKRGTECVRCPDSPAAVFVGAAIVLIFVAGLAYVLNKNNINIGYVSIAVDYFQVLAIFAQSKIPWPPALKELFIILSAFNLNIEIVAPECLVPDLAYRNKWSFVMALPVGIAAVFLVIHAVYTAYKRFVLRRGSDTLASHVGGFTGGLTMLMYLLYIYLVRSILDVYNCAPADPPEYEDPPANTRQITYMTAVFERCGQPGGTQLTLLGWAVVATIVYMLGYPVAVGYVLYKNRELVMEDQVLRAMHTGDDRLTNPRAYDVRKRFKNLYYQFRPDYCLWVLMILARKFSLAITYVIFNKNASFQLATALLVIFGAYAFQVRFLPYMSPGEYDVTVKEHQEMAAQDPKGIHGRIAKSVANIISRGRKRTHRNIMSASGKIDYDALLGVLRSWAFNYNTVEGIVLFCAFIVCLMGIMFAAQGDAQAYYTDARDACTAVAMTFGIVGILYVSLVIIAEIVIMLQASMETKRVRTGRATSTKKVAGKDGKSDKQILLGPVESAHNPIMMGASNSQHVVEALLQLDTVPESSMWPAFQRSFADVQTRVSALQKALQVVKAYQQRASVRIAAEEAEEDIKVARRKREFSTFKPTVARMDEGNDGAATTRPATNPLANSLSAFAAARPAGGRVGGLSGAPARLAASGVANPLAAKLPAGATKRIGQAKRSPAAATRAPPPPDDGYES